MRGGLAKTLLGIAPPVVVFGLVVLLWQLGTALYGIPEYLLPGPAAVWTAAHTRGLELVYATLLTGAGALAGFFASLVGGVLVALLFSQSRLIERSLYPYAIFLQTVPIVAIAPLIILWFGNGFQSVVLIAFIVSVFPIITNTTEGLTSVDRSLTDLFRLYGASRAQVMWRLRLPHAIPSLLVGARVASGLSVIGAIIGEFFAGYSATHHGLGYMIILTSGQLKTAALFAAILASTVLGLTIFGGVGLVSNRLLSRWQDRS